MTRSITRTVAVLGMVLAMALGAIAPGASAQDGGFPLPANAAFCEPGYAGPFVGCTP